MWPLLRAPFCLATLCYCFCSKTPFFGNEIHRHHRLRPACSTQEQFILSLWLLQIPASKYDPLHCLNWDEFFLFFRVETTSNQSSESKHIVNKYLFCDSNCLKNNF